MGTIFTLMWWGPSRWRSRIDIPIDIEGVLFQGAVARAAAHKVVSYREIMRHQPPRVILRPFAFDVFSGLHEEA